MLSVITLSGIMLSVIMLSVILLSVIMLSIIMLSVIMLSVIMLSVVAPNNQAQRHVCLTILAIIKMALYTKASIIKRLTAVIYSVWE